MKLRSLPALLPLAAFLSGCDRPAPTPPPPAGERVFQTRGVVREIAPDRTYAVIRHEEIPGYMPRMVMELRVQDTNELAGIQANDNITFRLHATEETHWIDAIHKVGVAAGETATPAPAPGTKQPAELRPGDPMPDAELLSETGERIRLSDFRNHALAFTFFFTRCPLPDYCPRMNTQFSQARELLLRREDSPTNWQFLCISFDPDFDRPAVLASYAKRFRGTNTTRWLFANAAPEVVRRLKPLLDLMVTTEGGLFSHNLRTVVLDPQGRVHRQFDGNDWTPQQLAAAVEEAAQAGSAP